MSLNDKALLPDDQSLDPTFALRPSSALLDSGSGEWTTSAPVPAGDSMSAPQLSTYLHALRRHWVLATGLGILAAAILAPAVWFGMGARYTAEAFLQCNLMDDVVIKERNLHVPTDIEFDVFKNTQMQMMTNRQVLTAALRREVTIGTEKVSISKTSFLADQEDPADYLSKKISVSFPLKAEVMRVSLTTPKPVEAAAIVSAVVDSYIAVVVDDKRKIRDNRISDLKSLSIEKAQEVKDSMNELRRMAESLGTSDSETLNIQQKNTLDELANFRAEFIRSQFDLNRIRGEVNSLQAVLKVLDEQPVSEIDVTMAAQTDPFLRELATQLFWEQQRNQMSIDSIRQGSTSKVAQQAMGGMTRLQKQYEAGMERLRQQVAIKRKTEFERDLKRFEAQVATLSKQQELTMEEVKKLRKEADRFGQSSIDMQMRREDIKSRQKSLEGINGELESLRVEAKTADRVKKMYEGSVETPKIEASYMMRLALTCMAAMVGFCVPFFGIVVWDLQSSRINGADEVSDQLGLQVIGSVPRIPPRILHHQGTPKKSHHTWQLRLTESVDSISARLLRQAETEQRRVVMVTSAVNGEGKTTLAAQLAMSLSRAGRRTLLVDFDLRQPTFDEVFGLPRTPGISEILRGECELANCIHPTGTENLSVLTAGAWDRFALSALANHSVASMFKELREDYEFVIVDSSPILPIADSRFVSQYVDSVVLCVFRDISQAPHIRATCEILEAFGVRSVEAVVTGVNEYVSSKQLAYYHASTPEAVGN